jgi:hypothetical protein
MNLWKRYHADIMVPRFFFFILLVARVAKNNYSMFQILVLGKNIVTTKCQRRHRGTSGHIQTQILVSTEIFLASHRTRYGQIFIMFSATTAPRQANGLIPLSTSVNFCGIIPSICFLVLKTKGVLFIFYFFLIAYLFSYLINKFYLPLAKYFRMFKDYPKPTCCSV